MEDMKQAAEVLFKGEPETPSEYRFVYSKNEIRRNVFFYFIVLLANLALGADIIYKWEKYDLLFFVLFGVIQSVSQIVRNYYSFYPRLSITFNQEGVTSTGFPLSYKEIPRQCAWSEFSKIRKMKLPAWSIMSILSGGERRIVFIPCFGVEYVLPIGNRKRQFYTGVGHSLSIEEALERFVGPIENLSAEEEIKIWPRTGSTEFVQKIDRKVGHVAYAALGMAIVAAVLILMPERPRAFSI